MEITKIIVGVDFSPESELAAKYAVKIARHTGAEVVLVHVGMVIDTIQPAPLNQASREWESIVRDQLAEDRSNLEALRERLATSLPAISHMMIDGFPDKGLCDAAEQLGADLVITGTHGRTGVKRFLLGSIAERVVRMCESNVMVVRPGADKPGGFERILVPTDFSPQAEKALQLALVLAAPGARIEVLHVWNTPPEIAMEWTGPILEQLAEQASAQGDELLGRHTRDDLTIAFDAVRANAKQGIAEHMDKGDYDLVLMGSHGRRGIRRFMLGSIAELTVRHAPCSVLVVHDRDDD